MGEEETHRDVGEEGRRPEIDRLETNDPGTDPEDPYADVDLADLPAWWRRAVREFDDHGLRPYRPPRFVDGTPTHEVVPDLEADLGVDVAFRSVGGDHDTWGVYVDGARVRGIGRHRSPSGYTVYEVTAEEFERSIREYVESADSTTEP